MDRFLVVGSAGREAAFASKLATDAIVYAVMDHENPMIIEASESTGGAWTIGNTRSPTEVTKFAQNHAIDYAFVSSDEPLAAGVIDDLLAAGIKAVGATKDAARIEWDKIWATALVNRICPEIVPLHRIVRSIDELHESIAWFEESDLEVVVKPQGLTGGKGVKVMGPHLKTYADCHNYASSLLRDAHGEGVLLVERLDGIEFTIMGLTDGTHLVISPASYDYPYRFEGDTGPGTGGMGCFTGPAKELPFMTSDELAVCWRAMDAVLREMRQTGLRFTGVLNGGFFLTNQGLRFMEFNGRFGDPEVLNILQVLRTPFSDVVRMMWHQTLAEDAVSFVKQASVVKYLVGPEYPAAGRRIPFSLNAERASELRASTWTASCTKNGDSLISLGRSRAAAVGAMADTISKASDIVEDVIAASETGDLQHRRDVGTKHELDKLTNRAKTMRN